MFTRRTAPIALLGVFGLVSVAALSFGKPGTKSAAASVAASQSAAASATPPPAALPEAVQKAHRGVALLERQGRVIALGTVLANDGRILTSLSPLGDGNGITARYAEGKPVAVRVGHSDRTWDLALLVPQTGRWDEGLVAGPVDALRSAASVYSVTGRTHRVASSTVRVKGRTQLVGADDEPLPDALEITTRPGPGDLGAPLLDEQGRVLGVLSRACAPNDSDSNAACRPVVYAAPVEALRQFLRAAPPQAAAPSPWLGIQGVTASTPYAQGVRVMMVHPSSPAAAAGLRGADDPSQADVIIAVDGTPVQSPERLAALVKAHAVGDKAELIVLKAGKYRVVTITLRPAPQSPEAASK